MPQNFVEKKCLFCGHLYIIDKHDICKKCILGQQISPKKKTLERPELLADCLNYSDSKGSQDSEGSQGSQGSLDSPNYKSNITMKPLPMNTIHLKEQLDAIKQTTLDKSLSSEPAITIKSLLTNTLDKITMPSTLMWSDSLSKTLRTIRSEPAIIITPLLTDALDKITISNAIRRIPLADSNSLSNTLRTIRSEQNIIIKPGETAKNTLETNPDPLSKTLRYTNSESNMRIKPQQIGAVILPSRRRNIAHSDLLSKSILSDFSKRNTTVILQPEQEKKKKLKTLQLSIMDMKQKLYAAKEKLAVYSILDRSASYTAARLECSMAEQAVEDACKEWCRANRGS